MQKWLRGIRKSSLKQIFDILQFQLFIYLLLTDLLHTLFVLFILTLEMYKNRIKKSRIKMIKIYSNIFARAKKSNYYLKIICQQILMILRFFPQFLFAARSIFSYLIECSFPHDSSDSEESQNVGDNGNDKLVQIVHINDRFCRPESETFKHSSSVRETGKFRIIAAFYLIDC